MGHLHCSCTYECSVGCGYEGDIACSFLSGLTCVASSVYILCTCVYMRLSTNLTWGHETASASQPAGQEGRMSLESVAA